MAAFFIKITLMMTGSYVKLFLLFLDNLMPENIRFEKPKYPAAGNEPVSVHFVKMFL